MQKNNRWFVLFIIAISLGAPAKKTQADRPGAFIYALNGCSMAHCDIQMTDHANLPPPLGEVRISGTDSGNLGSGLGLGCSSNGKIAACTFQNGTENNLIVYDSAGNRLWTSGTLLNANANKSVPMIDGEGNIIAADDKTLIRFNASGDIVWQTQTAGGIPISPVVTANGTIVLATKGGPISAYSSSDGHFVGSIWVKKTTGTSTLYFGTINTPCVVDNRIYVSDSANDSQKTGALLAIDVDLSSSTPLTVAWYFTFGGPSGASPLCQNGNIYFDGMSPLPGQAANPQIFAIRDNGTNGTLLWSKSVPNNILASFAADPRGGFWDFPNGYYFERRDYTTGDIIDTIYPGTFVPGVSSRLVPASAMTISNSSADPIMITGLLSADKQYSYISAIDLASKLSMWNLDISSSNVNNQASGQFPIMLDPVNGPTIIFTTFGGGAYFISSVP